MTKTTEKKKPKNNNPNWFMKKEKPTRAEMKPWVDILTEKIKEMDSKKPKVDDLPS